MGSRREVSGERCKYRLEKEKRKYKHQEEKLYLKNYNPNIKQLKCSMTFEHGIQPTPPLPPDLDLM